MPSPQWREQDDISRDTPLEAGGGCWTQRHPHSTTHDGSHPSPPSRLPSSHSSPASRTPLPQALVARGMHVGPVERASSSIRPEIKAHKSAGEPLDTNGTSVPYDMRPPRSNVWLAPRECPISCAIVSQMSGVRLLKPAAATHALEPSGHDEPPPRVDPKGKSCVVV